MAKLVKMKYRTVGGDLKINTYNATISKKLLWNLGLILKKKSQLKQKKGKSLLNKKSKGV